MSPPGTGATTFRSVNWPMMLRGQSNPHRIIRAYPRDPW